MQALGVIGSSGSEKAFLLKQAAQGLKVSEKNFQVIIEGGNQETLLVANELQEQSIPVTITGYNNLQSFVEIIQAAAKQKVGFILYEGFISRDPIELAQIAGSFGITHRSITLVDASQLELQKKLQSLHRSIDAADLLVITETDTINDSTSTITDIRKDMNFSGIAFPYSESTAKGIVDDIRMVFLASPHFSQQGRQYNNLFNSSTGLEHRLIPGRVVSIVEFERFFRQNGFLGIESLEGTLYDSKNNLQNIQYLPDDASFLISPPKSPHSEIRIVTSNKKLLQKFQELSFIEIQQSPETFVSGTTPDEKNKIVHQLTKKYRNLSKVESLDELLVDCPFDVVISLALDSEIQASIRQYANDSMLTYRLDLYDHFSCLFGRMSASNLQHQVLVAYSNAISLQATFPKHEARWPKIAHIIAKTGYALGYQRIFQKEFPISTENISRLENISASKLYFMGLKLLKTPLFDKDIPEEHPTIAAMLFENGYRTEPDFDPIDALSTMSRLAQVSAENNQPEWEREWKNTIKYCTNYFFLKVFLMLGV